MQDIRLLDSFLPEHYDLSLTLDRIGRAFHGTVTIKGTSLNPVDSIDLHAKDLTIASVTFDGKTAEFSHGKHDRMRITHPDLADGNHLVVIEFSGTITDAMHGLYPCYYDHDGVKKELLATQFESHHAREVFPCIDEPAAKATFSVTLTTEPDIIVLGNMPVAKSRLEDGHLVTSFETTPRMSTYLLAWVTGELQRVTGRTKSDVEVNVWATPAQSIQSLDFALSIATRTIDFLDDYFGVPYPLPKSDHIALPDFSSGAMENWGLVTYREVALLADPRTTSISAKHYIATVIAHELSHQWFGNLVTMKWWNDLWLNESFATLVEYIVVDALEPQWNIWLDFSSYESLLALRRDSIDGVQPVQVDVHNPDEIRTLFDGAIVYAKGAKLLRMLQHYIGHDAFRTGLKMYFEEFKYQNTTATDLWKHLTQASGIDVGTFMDQWIARPGYPVLKVVQNQDQSISLTQKQFFVGPHDDSDKLWPIPLDSSCSEMPTLFDGRSGTYPRSHTTPLRFNVSDAGHFISQYDDRLLTQIITSLPDATPLSRLQLINEQSLLAKAGATSSASLIGLLHHYTDDQSEPVWDLISVALNELKKFVESDKDSERRLRRYVGNLVGTQFDRLGMEFGADEPENDIKLRSTILAHMIYGKNQVVIDECIRLYDQTAIDQLNPEIRALVIGVKVRDGNDMSVVDKLLASHRSTASSDIQQDIAAGLTSTRNPDVYRRLIELLTDTSTIRSQDFIRWFAWLLRNHHSRRDTWDWTRANWEWIKRTFSGDMHYDDFPRYVASAMNSRDMLDEYRTFFEPLQNEAPLKRNIIMGLKEIEGRVELLERDGPAVHAALVKFDE